MLYRESNLWPCALWQVLYQWATFSSLHILFFDTIIKMIFFNFGFFNVNISKHTLIFVLKCSFCFLPLCWTQCMYWVFYKVYIHIYIVMWYSTSMICSHLWMFIMQDPFISLKIDNSNIHNPRTYSIAAL